MGCVVPRPSETVNWLTGVARHGLVFTSKCNLTLLKALVNL